MADTPSGANAPYKIQKHNGKWVVVNNAGLVKGTFDGDDAGYQKALAFQRALYVNVPGAAKRADKVKFTGKTRDRVPAEKSWVLIGNEVVRFDGTPIREFASVELAEEYMSELESNLWFEQAKSFSEGQRKKLSKSGAALPDGSFPIENTGDLKNAIQAIGRASDPAKAKAHIKKRAAALDATGMLPKNW